MNEDCVYKVLLLGDSTVGKTCFLLRYCDKTFQEAHLSTIGLDYRLKTIVLKSGKKIKLQIWDTAGQDKYRSITRNYYKGAHGIILIYDVTNLQTYENVKNWIMSIREETTTNVVIFLAGNKIDVDEKLKEVKTENGQKIADEYNIKFYETSAKDGTNVNTVFEDLVQDIDDTFSKLEGTNKSETKNKLFNGKSQKKCC